MKQQILAALAALLSFKQEMKAKFNGAIEKLPPLEGLEVASNVRDVLWSVDWAARRMKEIGDDVDQTAQKAEELMSKYEQEVGDQAIAAAIAAKTHFTAEAHQAAIDEAVTKAKDEAESDFKAKLQAAKLVFDRRAEAIASLGESAATLTDEDLEATDYKDRVAVLEARKETLTKVGITPEAKAKVFTSLMAHRVDDAGKKAFDEQFEILKEAAGGEFTATADPLPPGPKRPAGTPPSGAPPAAKKAVI